MFNLPTLVTITAPSCAGKNHLLEAMVRSGFGRIVSTTDRAPREGEIEGLHYFFISTEKSKQMEADGEFAELITYNGTRYGVTKAEMTLKLAADMPPPIVILEPQGLTEYRKFCDANRYMMFSVYVETQESVRLQRLVDRTTNELIQAVYSLANNTNSLAIATRMRKIVATNNSRLKEILSSERLWSHANRWDAIVDGTDVTKALMQIGQGVKNRNARSDIYK
jgi:guanylate kinase